MIGQTILAEAGCSNLEGVILSGCDYDGNETSAPGTAIDLDGEFSIRCACTGERLIVRGWMVSIELVD